MTTLILSVSTSVICCVVAAPMGWLVARTDMPGSHLVRLLVTASFVTPPFPRRDRLGIAGRAQ